MNTSYFILLLFLKCITCSVDRRKKTTISKRRDAYNRVEYYGNINTKVTNKMNTSITTIPNKTGITRRDGNLNSSVTTLPTRFQRTEIRRSLPNFGLFLLGVLTFTLVTTFFNITNPYSRIKMQQKLFYILQIFSFEDYCPLLELCEKEINHHGQLLLVPQIPNSLKRTASELIEPGKWMGMCEGWGLREQAFGVSVWIALLILVLTRVYYRIYSSR